MRVAEPAVAAPGQDDPLAFLGQISEEGFSVFIQDLCADRDLEHRVFATLAGAIGTHAVPAAGGLVMLLIAKVDERIEIVHAFGDHVTAASAVAAVRAAKLNERLAAKANAAVAAVAALYIYLLLIQEFHGSGPNTCVLTSSQIRPSKKGNGRPFPLFLANGRRLCQDAGSTATNVLPAPFLEKATVPSVNANKV